MKTKQEEMLERVNNIQVPQDLVDLEVPLLPRKNKVVIKKVDSQRVTAAGLIIPEINKSNRPLGRIIALGPECPDDLRIGLLVVYDTAFDFPLVLDGMDYVMLSEPFIDAIIENEKRVHLPLAPVTGKEIKRIEKVSENKRVRAIFKKESENATDKYHEDLKARKANPSKFK